MPSFLDGNFVSENVAGFYLAFFSSSLDPGLPYYRQWRSGIAFDYVLAPGGGNWAVWDVPLGKGYAFYQINGFVPGDVGLATVNLRIATF
jgi:hypothetical protein